MASKSAGSYSCVLAYCRALKGWPPGTREDPVDFKGLPENDEGVSACIVASARRLFAAACGRCRIPCDGTHAVLSSTMRTMREHWAANEILRATFDLMRTIPIVAKKERRDGR